MTVDPLAKWRHPGAGPAKVKESHGIAVVAPPSGIQLREYKAFLTDAGYPRLLQIRSSLIKKPEADIAYPYSGITEITSDGYGFVLGIIFSLPFPIGSVSVTFRGEGMAPLVDAILNGSVKKIEVFDPDRHVPCEEGKFEIEADQWRGPCVIRDIAVH